jgi:peptidoglycan/xylan/chitin deacetylase (PgdA/CDA1 family)
MRIVVACGLIVLSILAALGFAQTQNSAAPTAKPQQTAEKPAAQQRVVVSTTTEASPIVVATSNQPAPTSAPAPAAAQSPAAAPAPVTAPTAPPQAQQAAAPAPAPVNCPGNPNALGVSRTVEIDTTGGPGFGFEHFKQYDFLRPGEVVLTFDDGPWLNNTPRVLAALAAHCTEAIFFPIGKHATYYPDILKEVADAGHSIGSHTWSHQDLSKKTPEEAKTEIEMGISAVKMAIGPKIVPFFRFPALRHPPEMVTYLGERNIAIFSTDMDSFDFKMRKPDQVVKSVMDKLKKHGKGIVLMHDFQHATSEGIAQLLNELKAGGYKVVFVKAKGGLDSLPQYDEMVQKENKMPTTAANRPMTDVIKTINE